MNPEIHTVTFSVNEVDETQIKAEDYNSPPSDFLKQRLCQKEHSYSMSKRTQL